MGFALQEGLQAVCQGLVHDLGEDDGDASTSAGSMSGTTMPAASKGGPAVAAKYLLQLGRLRWGWQENSGISVFRPQSDGSFKADIIA